MKWKSRTPPKPSNSRENESPSWGWLLTVWVVLAVSLEGLIWATGVPHYQLAEAVERGASQVEHSMVGEDSTDVVRKAIRLQQDSLSFWTVVAMVGDFVVKPLSLVLRAVLVAVAFGAVAAVSGRRVRYAIVLADCVRWQGVWVLGLAVQLVIMLALSRSSVETSVLLLMPPETYPATVWAMLRQLDLFAIVGWLGMAYSGWHRQQTNWVVALLTCASLAVVEGVFWAAGSLLVNLGARMTLMPQ